MKQTHPRPGADLLGPALQRYFCDYLIDQRSASPRTVESYRDCFKLLAGFLEQRRGILADQLTMADLDAPNILEFLGDLERSRANTARSRNLRLAAIRSFLRHAGTIDPLLLPLAQRVLSIPSKRFDRARIGHLTAQQIRALLEAPDASKPTGLRDRVLLMMMYNTGARASEIAGLRVGDLHLGQGGFVQIRGKGRKQRAVPLWRESQRLLKRWIKHLAPSTQAPLLANACGLEMTRAGVAQRLRCAHLKAAKTETSLVGLRVSPHTIRHTTAMHLLQAGVDLSVIAMWMGHESTQTTHQYLDADLETKKQALERLDSPCLSRRRPAVARPLMRFLEGL